MVLRVSFSALLDHQSWEKFRGWIVVDVCLCPPTRSRDPGENLRSSISSTLFDSFENIAYNAYVYAAINYIETILTSVSS